MLTAILVSFGVVFLAELGDKSQLITLTYALRHRWWVVLSGVGIAAFLVHGISVAIGYFLGAALPERPIAFAASAAFIGFRSGPSAKTLRFADLRAVDLPGAKRCTGTPVESRFAVLAIVSSFVLAELGTRPCWRRWLWRVTTTGRVSGSGPRRGWWWPMVRPSLPVLFCIAGCRRGFCISRLRCCSCCSGCGSCLTPALGWRPVAIGSHRGSWRRRCGGTGGPRASRRSKARRPFDLEPRRCRFGVPV